MTAKRKIFEELIEGVEAMKLTRLVARSRTGNSGKAGKATCSFLLLTNNVLGQRAGAAAISIRLRPVRLAA